MLTLAKPFALKQLLFDTGTFVTHVTATDMDDPNYGNSARLIYSILQVDSNYSVGERSFGSDRKWGSKNGLVKPMRQSYPSTSGYTILFTGLHYPPKKCDHAETSSVGEIVVAVMADDRDTGKNAEMIYKIKEKGDFSMFDIVTENVTQEGILKLKKALDSESKKTYRICVNAIHKHIDERLLKHGLFEDTPTVKIHVEDIDEPPVFVLKEYLMDILETASAGLHIGSVTAKDPDNINTPVRRWRRVEYSSSVVCRIAGASSIFFRLMGPLYCHVRHPISRTQAKLPANPAHVSEVPVYIRIIDVNDNCQKTITFMFVNSPNQERQWVRLRALEDYDRDRVEPIQTISAIDRDEATVGQQFSFTLIPEAANTTNFTVRDIKFNDDTATISTLSDGFNLHKSSHLYLPIEINDNGIPPLSSTNILTIHVCDCGMDSNAEVLLSFILLVAMKNTMLSEKGENIVKHDDEEGGEEDTEAILRKQKTRNRKFRTNIQSFYRMSLKIGPDISIFKEFLFEKIEEANVDTDSLPLNSLKCYAFEGICYLAGSLSSIESTSSDIDPNIQNICDWGLQIQSFPETRREGDALNQI
ncbi:hypothetical protein XELAEV_18031800mg [Xenopus laevis]|uniref:Cadherin domain-containing protein n=1 Tax=Xenopus laevis TaxID=8355 RepID=A0A974CNN8_XENLA|nr:hypothetical protein XELAEV_18031800mg [Xenopus laevis]